MAEGSRHGVAGRWLSPEQVEEVEPNLSPRVTGALLLPDDHQVDPQAMLAALERAVIALGGHIVTGARVTGFETAAGRLREVVGHLDFVAEPQTAAVARGLVPRLAAAAGDKPPRYRSKIHH